jgi:ABC-type sugar transport system ATPase subunit
MNCSLPALAQRSLLRPVRRGAESSASIAVIDALEVKGAPGQTLRTLSGGNQQKVALGRWLVRDRMCLLADEPTRGVDVRGRIAIHELLIQLAERGNCLVIHSTDPEELAAVCSRVIVLERGRIVSELVGEEITVRQLEAEVHGAVAGQTGQKGLG